MVHSRHSPGCRSFVWEGFRAFIGELSEKVSVRRSYPVSVLLCLYAWTLLEILLLLFYNFMRNTGRGLLKAFGQR